MGRQRPHTRRSKRGRKFRAGRGFSKTKVRRAMAWDIPKHASIQHMSPEKYLRETWLTPEENPQYFERYWDYETKKMEPLSKLSGYIKDPNVKVNPPFIEDPFITPTGKVIVAHEGRHRAQAAKEAGLEKIPVIVPLPIEKREKLAEKFIEKVFPESHESYKQEWRERFKKGSPHMHMDKKSGKIYSQLLEEEGLR